MLTFQSRTASQKVACQLEFQSEKEKCHKKQICSEKSSKLKSVKNMPFSFSRLKSKQIQIFCKLTLQAERDDDASTPKLELKDATRSRGEDAECKYQEIINSKSNHA